MLVVGLCHHTHYTREHFRRLTDTVHSIWFISIDTLVPMSQPLSNFTLESHQTFQFNGRMPSDGSGSLFFWFSSNKHNYACTDKYLKYAYVPMCFMALQNQYGFLPSSSLAIIILIFPHCRAWINK